MPPTHAHSRPFLTPTQAPWTAINQSGSNLQHVGEYLKLSISVANGERNRVRSFVNVCRHSHSVDSGRYVANTIRNNKYILETVYKVYYMNLLQKKYVNNIYHIS